MCPWVAGGQANLGAVEWGSGGGDEPGQDRSQTGVNAVETEGAAKSGWDLCALEVAEETEKEQTGWQVVVRKKSDVLRRKRERKEAAAETMRRGGGERRGREVRSALKTEADGGPGEEKQSRGLEETLRLGDDRRESECGCFRRCWAAVC